jgi:hypothetical protein
MKKHSALHLVLLIAALDVGLSPQARACQCGTRPPVDVALARSEVVVAGVVTEVKTVRVKLFPQSSYAQFAEVPRATLKVQKQWKGVPEHTVVLFAPGNCAYLFEAGRSYLVFAGRSDALATSALEASICLPTKPFRQAGPELALLGPPMPSRP